MNREIKPFKYNGSIYINSSKSVYQRAVALACFSKKKFQIIGDSNNTDSQTAIRICKEMGFNIVKSENNLEIFGELYSDKSSLQISSIESGLCIRLFGVLLLSFFNEVNMLLTGTAKERKFDFTSLKELGVDSFIKDSSILLRGKLNSGVINIDNPNTSQLLTGLLITLPFLKGDSIVYCKNPVSINYIDITLDLLEKLGIVIKNENYTKYTIRGNQTINQHNIIVEGDWSGAAFHFVGAAISGKIKVYGLNIDSNQGDKQILDLLIKCGAEVNLYDKYIEVKKNQLKSFTFDATDVPDLIPPLTVLASSCDGESYIYGTDRLINKESNRALSLEKEFSKLGVRIISKKNCFKIIGCNKIKGGYVDSHNDHRIAMALSVMATVAKTPVAITNSSVVDKSNSRFYNDLDKISKLN
mgnify:FL=1